MQVAKKIISDQLSTIYPKQEIESLSRLIFEKVLGLSRIQIHLNQSKILSAANLTQIKEIVNRLSQFEPIQYILGETEFYGLPLNVNRAVLIPRQETEELVEWIISDHRQLSPNILDIGTGSGCIPIALAKNLPGSTATGWDISTEALRVAAENALRNEVKVDFFCVDILKPDLLDHHGKFDIIVSNPPYIALSEQPKMDRNVTHYEPHLALFVPDNDPLIFYRKITELASCLLNPKGLLYFEINEKYGTEMGELLQSKGFRIIELRKDINGKARMMKGEKNSIN